MVTNLEAIASNPFVTLGSFGLAIVGIVLAILFYIKSKKERLPCFEKSSSTLIEGLHKSLDGLELLYKGSLQDRITVTRIAFWNAGRETIDKSDLLSSDPIRVKCPTNLDVLDIQVTQVSQASNSVSISDPVNSETGLYYQISFEYLDHEDYFVLQIIHNGTSVEKFELLGKVKGVKELKPITSREIQRKTMIKIIPFLPFGDLVAGRIASPAFMKYGGPLIYTGFGVFGLWNLAIGKTDWYVWVLTGFCFVASVVMYYGYRFIAPVKI